MFVCFSVILVICVVFFFFFQAEDGIRDTSVTGVQTCALPISTGAGRETVFTKAAARRIRAAAAEPLLHVLAAPKRRRALGARIETHSYALQEQFDLE